MRMASGSRAAAWSTVVAALTLLAGPIAAASPATAYADTGAPPGPVWAYGAQANVSATWTNASGGYTAALTAFFGWDVVITQTNTSGSVTELHANRTMALDLYVTYCKPNCANAAVTANASFRAWETEDGFANLTSNGTVYANGGPEPALAILNASDRVRANMTESLDGAVHVLLATKPVRYYFTVQAESQAAVAFSPALGLVPLSVGAGSTWNSTSDFAASGSWAADFMFSKAPLAGPVSDGARSVAGNVSGSGTVGVHGIDLGPFDLETGEVTDAIALLVVGPFHVREGFLFVPSDADVFGSGEQAWTSYSNGSASAATATIDVGSHLPHLGLIASATGYGPRSNDVSALGPYSTDGMAPQDSNGAGVLQAQPEPVTAAQGNSACLAAGTCPNQQGTGKLPMRVPVGAVGLLLAVVVVAALIAGGLVAARRRPVPPPPSPNASLYPPADAGPAPPVAAAPRRNPPGESADDPLGHLW